MKRIIALAVMAAFVLTAGMASAAEVKMQGQFDHLLQWTDKTAFTKKSGETDFKADQRIRLYFDYVASENVHGVVGFEISQDWGGGVQGTGTWGNDSTGIIKVKHAYTDFNVGGVGVRAGLQPIALPAAVAGSPVLGEDVFGITASYAVNDNFSLVGAWLRLRGEAGESKKLDAAALIAPITMDGWNMAPYFVYGWVGHNSAVSGGLAPYQVDITTAPAANDKNYHAMWIGTSFNLTMFDPFVFMADIAYGSVDSNIEALDRSGWFMIAELDYKMDMFTPGLLFMYGSGDDDSQTNGSEAMPLIDNGGSFAPVSFGAPGGSWESTDGLLGTNGNLSLMGIGVVAKDISFLENLSHTARIVYFTGTSDEKTGDKTTGALPANAHGMYLTEKDSAWEVDFDSTYQIYENLSLLNQLNYIKMDRSNSAWNNASDYKDAWKFSFALRYRF